MNLRSCHLLILLLIIPLLGSAQQSSQKLLYRISAQEYESLLLSKQPEVSFLQTRHPVAFLSAYPADSTILAGHYLMIGAQGEELHWELFSKNLHRIYLHDDQKQLNLAIVDTLGREVTDAEVRFKQRKVRYDDKTKRFESRRLRPGLLRISLPGDTIFYQIETKRKRSVVLRRLSYFSGSTIGSVITYPIRLIRTPINYVRRGIGWGDWRIYHWPFERLYRRLKQRRQDKQAFTGFMATQQPLYRPGDTLKVAATLSNQKGRPYRKPLQFRIRSRDKTWIDTLLTASEPGRYSFQWFLADTLPLDTRYRMNLQQPKWRYHQSIQHQFQLEDYELDEFELEIVEKPSVFQSDDPVRFTVSAKDANDLPIPTAAIEATIVTEQVTHLFADKIYVPDTLWHFREEMGSRTRLALEPPDSIWPLVQMKAQLEVYFRGPSGELLKQAHRFSVERTPWQPKLTLANGKVLASVSGQSPEESSGQLLVYNKEQLLQALALEVGQQIPLNPAATRYLWQIGDEHTEMRLSQEQPGVYFNYEWQNDSLRLQWSNPHQLSLQWTLQASRSTIQEGQDSNRQVQIVLPLKQGKRQVWLSYSYYWAGQIHSSTTDVKALRQQLSVELRTPKRVYPGEKRTIEVQVRDDQGRAVAGAPVLAGAYNAQMRKGTPYTLTDIQFKGRRRSFHRQSYQEERAIRKGQFSLSDGWYQPLSLDSLLYYQLRRPGQQLFTHYRNLQSEDSTAQKSGQIAPFVVANHRTLPVHLVYLDNRLVYVSKAWQDTPYSIVAEPGYHKLAIRTSKAEIRIDSVLLQPRQQLVLSVDMLRVNNQHVQVLPRSTKLTDSEIQLLERHLFYLGPNSSKQGKQYFYAQPEQIFMLQPKPYGITHTGLFSSSQQITRLRPGLDTLKFRFEPYFYYEIDQKRDRLYQHRPYSKAEEPDFSSWQSYSPLGEEALFLSDIKPPERPWRYLTDEPPTEAAAGRGRLCLFSDGPPSGSKVIFLSEGDTLRYILPTRLPTFALPAGNYTLNWYTGDEQLWQYEVKIIAYHTLALRVDSTQMTRLALPSDWELELLTSRFYAPPSIPSISRAPAISRPRSNFVGTGQLLSGYITDNAGEPLIGATILIKGTTMGTVTDIDGYYELWGPATDAELVVSYTGFESREIAVGTNAGSVDIVLNAGVELSEVVVIGYSAPLVKKNAATITALRARVAGITVAELEEDRNSTEQLAISGDLIPPPQDSIRDSFRDYAYWQPLLATDENGRVRFTPTFPDDITNWRHFVLATDRKARLGLQEAYTQAYLPLQAQLYTPRFLVEGDRSEVIGLFNNRTNSPQQLTTFFTNWDGERREEDVEVDAALRQTYPIGQVPEQDSLTLSLGLIQGEYRDGEKRTLPVFPRGVERTEGQFLILRDAQEQRLEVDANKGPVYLRIGGNALPQLQAAIERLRFYPHGCNEQTASRLLALLANEQLAQYDNSLPDVSKEIRTAIQRLIKNRHSDGKWGWWSSSTHSSDWITRHVIRALDEAEAQGYHVPDVEVPIRKMISELTTIRGGTQWQNLLFLAERGQILDYKPYLLQLDSMTRNLEWEFLYRRLQQLSGATYTLDSLTKKRQETFTGGAFWGKTNRWYSHPYRQTTGLTLQALQLYRTAQDSATVQAIEQFLLEPPQTEGTNAYYHLGFNTYEASLLVQQLLPAVLGPDEKLTNLQVFLRNAQQTEVLQDFPNSQTLEVAEARQSSMRKTGSGPAFVNYYQRYWDEQPQVEDAGFRIQTAASQSGQAGANWESGTAAQLSTYIQTEKNADYVMIEIPVPGGCSYGPKTFGESRWETHREYRRDRVVIYCEHLPAGNYTFTVPLEPRFAGQYHVNPAQAEMMYIPTVYGIGNTLQVEIE